MTTTPGKFKGDNATGNGFKNTLKVVDRNAGLAWLAIENSKNMFVRRKLDNYERSIDVQDKHMRKRGFLAASHKVTSEDFGVPQSRGRSWSLYLKTNKIKDFVISENVLTNMFTGFKCLPMPIETCLVTSPTGIDAIVTEKKYNRSLKWHTEFDNYQVELGKAGPDIRIETIMGCI
jgi:site-specific DNA-cytosine methylase